MKPVTKAVIELGGVWPGVKLGRVVLYSYENCLYAAGKDLDPDLAGDPICTRKEFDKEKDRLRSIYEITSHPCRNFEEWVKIFYREPLVPPATNADWQSAPTWATQIIEDDHGYYFWHDGAGKYQLILGISGSYANGIKTKRVVETRPLSRDLIKAGLEYHAKLARSQGREGDAMLFEAAAGEVGNG